MTVEVLAQLIDQKRQLLEQLWEVAQRQNQWVQQGDMEKLMSVLSVKQQFLATLQSLETRLDPYRQEDPDARQWQSPQQRQQTRDAAARCEALLQAIMELDKQSEAELVRRRDVTAANLQGLHGATRVRSAYEYAAGPPVASLDLSSET